MRTKGAPQKVRFHLPRGGYVPSITLPDTIAEERQAVPVTVPSGRQFPFWAAFASGVLAMALAGWLLWRPAAGPEVPAAGPLWNAFLQPGVETVVSFGAPMFHVGDNGLYIRDVDVNSPGQNRSQTLRTIEKSLGISLRPQDDVYTGIGEALGMLSITRWLDKYRLPVTVANSHYQGPSNLKGKNAIIVSSLRFQTVLSSMELPNLFPFDQTGPGWINNAKPLPGEPSRWGTTGGGLDTAAALISLWPAPTKDRRILFLGGINTWATEAAVKYVLDPKMIADLEKRLASDPVNGLRGRKSPYFQVIILAEAKYNELRIMSYVTHRYLPVH